MGLGVLLTSSCVASGKSPSRTWSKGWKHLGGNLGVGIEKDVLMNFQTHRGCLPWKVVSALSLEKSVQDEGARQEVEGT